MTPKDVIGKFIKIKCNETAYKRYAYDSVLPYRMQDFFHYNLNTILLVKGYEFTINDYSHIMFEVIDSDMRTSLIEYRLETFGTFIEVLE